MARTPSGIGAASLARRPAPSLGELAVQHVRRRIVRGQALPGQKLNEVLICEELGISRTPVREALKLLAAEGLVELRRNRNPVVAAVDVTQVADLFEVESGLESMAARLAASRITRTGLDRLQALQLRMEAQHLRAELDGYFETNQKIHRLVVASAGNSVLRATHDWLLGRLERARYMALHVEGRWEQSIVEHRGILAALQDRDAESAGRLFGAHVERTGSVVLRIIAGQTPPEAGGAGED